MSDKMCAAQNDERTSGRGPWHQAALLVLALSACVGRVPDEPPALVLVSADHSDLALPDLSAAWRERFNKGDAEFEKAYRAANGLGPLYIRSSCASCHASDAKGPGFVTKMVVVDDEGQAIADQSALAYGHTQRPFVAGGAVTGIDIPQGINVALSTRIGPSVFARGYIEAVSDEAIEAVEAAQAATGDVSGRIHRVAYQSEANPDTRFHTHAPGQRDLVGKFGLKARIATLDEFTADAFVGDMGITSPLRPNELPNPDGLTDDDKAGLDATADVVNEVADYMRLLALPVRAAPNEAAASLFVEVQCATCHVPSLHTRADYPIEALQDIDAPLFTDLLLHDMGEGLKDDIVDGDAGPREWKTAPLIGMRFLRSLMHDGRATTVHDAVVAHRSEGSEANVSVERYLALTTEQQQVLNDYVMGL